MRVATPRGLHVRPPGSARLALFVLVLALPAAARATNEAASKRDGAVCLWLAPAPGCPAAKQTEAAVEDILGRRVFTTESCDIDVKGAMRRLEQGGWEARLSFAKSDGEALGERSLQSTDTRCAALQGPVALAISMMVEAGEADVTLHVPAGESPTGLPAARMSMGFTASSGLLPRLGYGASAAYLSRPLTWFPLQLDATVWFPQSTTDATGTGGQFWAWHAGAGYCPTLLDGSVAQATACVGFEAGAIHGTGVGIAYAGSPTKPYGDLHARASLSVPIVGPLQAWVQVGVGVPWVRAQFVYLDAGDASVPVHRPSAVVLFGSLGLALRASGAGRTASP